ncbi:hypothetical protein [Pedosphaera parvula]|uniref:Uncharacterized protein n=1 Tax=Pedosphaera parvula (strain Ellin514) TaxID=320771 RepID=B9XSE5_PEDPL|nr:hypothetical protein [Pedosphaera parvula]EEF57245.1 hypothetical protein Cflav_PD0292 [Pedosphaera parvula Ellin514]
MKLNRLKHDPTELLEFYEQGLSSIGALCERTWHDRLEVIADGRAANLWNPKGTLHQVELHFTAPNAVEARDATREVFPGCPLTFQLAEALRPALLPLERFVLADQTAARPPDAAVAGKIWYAQFADTSRWQLTASFKPDFHFSFIGVVRCEIQAMDQHWSLHRVAISLPGGESDEGLARDLSFQQAAPAPAVEIAWPTPDPARWRELLALRLENEVAEELVRVRIRQENSLRRELERIDDYFENYQRELTARAGRSANENSKVKTADRLAAAKAEHARRRADQLARHEIRIQPHLDALLLVAEKAWRTRLQFDRAHRSQAIDALFVSRSRRWVLAEQKSI